jgi:hypothetical protein
VKEGPILFGAPMGQQAMKHVVNFSGGLGSFFAALRVVAEHGIENVTLLFADVGMEDEDLYRFIREASKFLGVPLTTVSEGRSVWDLFESKGMLGNSRFPLCSVILKREVLDKWRRENCIEMDTVIYLGHDWTEMHRLEATRNALPGWRVEAPMCEPPYWDKCRMVEEIKKLGIDPPRLYTMGFPHNNCGGFCVKAGHAHFAHLLKTMPERYAFHEAKEEAFRAKVGDHSVMKDRRGGVVKSLTLKMFRERIEAGESFDRTDWGGCGCAGYAGKMPDLEEAATKSPLNSKLEGGAK